jgi:hypothetical protein
LSQFSRQGDETKILSGGLQSWRGDNLIKILQYLEGCIERTLDIYLSELKEELKDVCGVKVTGDAQSRLWPWAKFESGMATMWQNL